MAQDNLTASYRPYDSLIRLKDLAFLFTEQAGFPRGMHATLGGQMLKALAQTKDGQQVADAREQLTRARDTGDTRLACLMQIRLADDFARALASTGRSAEALPFLPLDKGIINIEKAVDTLEKIDRPAFANLLRMAQRK